MSSSTVSSVPSNGLTHHAHAHSNPPRDEVVRRTWQERHRHHRSSPQQPQQQPSASTLDSSSSSSSSSSSAPPACDSSSAQYPMFESLHVPGQGRDRRKGRGGGGGRRGGRLPLSTVGQGPNAQSTEPAVSCGESHEHGSAGDHPLQAAAAAAALSSASPSAAADGSRGRGRRRSGRGRSSLHPAHLHPHTAAPCVALQSASPLTLQERAQLANASEQNPLSAASSSSSTSSPQSNAVLISLSSSLSSTVARRRPPPHSQSQPSMSSSSSFTALSQHLISRLLAHAYECCVCNELLSSSTAVWACSACFLLVHHRCIERWFHTKRVQQGSLGGEVAWPCPGCLSQHTGRPAEYRCFCGKLVDPEPNPYITPHSCGQPCGKMRGRAGGGSAGAVTSTRCVHPCTQPCHPGPCAPCVVMLNRKCGCGRGSYQVRCGSVPDVATQTCGLRCDKLLTCGHHRCSRVCHEGPCEDCAVVSLQSCWCGARSEERRCGTEEGRDAVKQPHFSCQQPCNAALDCGHHRCELFCHPGPHPPCPRLPASPQLCACGKTSTSVQRLDCREPLPLCSNPCGKWLSCGFHRCEGRCHDGDCGDCDRLVRRVCRCGHDVVAMPCKLVREQQNRIERETAQRLEAGLPPLEEDEAEQLFVCDRPCKARLSCGQHGCPNRCCPPSTQHLCMRTCDRPLSCGQHRCDEHCHGQTPCPPCRVVIRQPLICHCERSRLPANLPCGTTLKCPHPCTRIRPCGHSCAMKCHDGPCEALAPCAVLTERMCAGGHRLLKNIPCYAPSVSCGVQCKRTLSCGQHLCTRTCHAGPCKVKGSDDVVESCGQKCGNHRSSCGHLCKALCHPSLPCPDVVCDELVTVHCPCGRRTVSVRCGASNLPADEAATTPSTSSSSSSASSLECDDACEVELRNARLRELLSVDDSRPELPYPSMLMQAVLDRQLLDFCVRSERKLNDWLDDSAASTRMFPSMKADQRWLLHQLSAHYQLTSESVDAEPNRSVRFIRSTRSAIPSVSLSSATRTFINGKTGKGGGVRGVDERLVLHLIGLAVEPRISVPDVRVMFHDWEGRFRLHWMDDDHAMATFDQRGMLETARERLLTRGLWTEERDERMRRQVEGDGELPLCLYRKLRTNESGRVEGAVRERDRKKTVTSHDGFTSVITVKRGAGAATGGAWSGRPPLFASPASSSHNPQSAASAAAAPRPIVSLRGLQQLQQRHREEEAATRATRAEDLATAAAAADGWRRPADEQPPLEEEADSADSVAEGAMLTVDGGDCDEAVSERSVVGLYVPAVAEVKRGNRWAALMEDEAEAKAGQEHQESHAEDAEGEDDWSRSAATRSNRRRGQQAKQRPAERTHSTRHTPAASSTDADDSHSAW